MVRDPKTLDKTLDELIERARDIPMSPAHVAGSCRRPMSPEQPRAQRRSFAYGNCNIDNPYVTRTVIARADADFDRIFGSD